MKAHLDKAVLTDWQMKAVKEQMQKLFDKRLDRYNREAALQVLYILHFDFGFGEQRLKRFANELKSMQDAIIEQYECDEEDKPYVCEIKLQEAGIDIDSILNEGSEKDDL